MSYRIPIQRLGQGLVIVCFLFLYLYFLFGKAQWSTTYFFAPIVRTASSWIFASRTKVAVLLVITVVPILLAGSIATLLAQSGETSSTRKSNEERHQTSSSPKPWYSFLLRPVGDWNLRSLRLWGLVVPMSVLTLTTLLPRLYGNTLRTNTTLDTVANGLADVTLWPLAFLLIPVAQYSPILQLFSGLQHPVPSLILHQCLGYMVMIGVVHHVALHCYRWVAIQHESLFRQFVIPHACWNAALSKVTLEPSFFCDDVSTTVPNDCTCFGRFRNVTGLIATFALLSIMATTVLPHIRRTWYALFYIVHLVAGPLVLLGTILHWNRSIVYLAGGFLYYVACSFPVWWEQYWRRQPSGVRITSVERIGTTRPVVALTIEATPAARQLYRPGQYVKLQAPELSRVSHPFTINTVLSSSDEDAATHPLRILFRCVGPFTNTLAQRLMGQEPHTPLPVLHLQGFYGFTQRLEQVQRHDHVVFVAGGIGITPFLSLLHEAVGAAASSPHLITLHWVCRDPELIDYVQKEYLHPMLDVARHRDRELQIVIHRTDPPQPMGRSYSSFDHSRPAALQDVPPFVEKKAPLQDVPGVPFAPSQVFPGSRQSYAANIPFFVAFSLIVWTGLAIIWYCMNRWPSSTITFPLLIAPTLIGMVAIVVSAAVYWCCTEHPSSRRSTAHEWTPLQQYEGLTTEVVPADSPPRLSLALGGAPEAEEPTHLSETTHLPMEVRQGRPTVYQFLNRLEDSRDPGLFVCGPPCLLRDVRSATQARSQHRQCSSKCRSAIALYEESFEM